MKIRVNRRADSTLAYTCIAAVLVLASCRESARVAMVSPVPEARPMTATLAIARAATDDSSYTVTLRLDSAATISRVGSVTAAIDFDTTRVRFVGDASPGDNALRAAHVDRGRVRVAVASAQGLEATQLIQLTFVTHDESALTSMKLEVSELHLLDATDLKRTLNVLPPGGGAPIGIAPTVSTKTTPAVVR